MVEKATLTTHQTEIHERSDETSDECIARCLPGVVNPRITGMYPLGAFWEMKRGLVVEYETR